MIRLDEKCCEMKRLYVRPAYRNEHLGSRLVDRLIDHARKSGFSLMRLDTLPFLESAVRLYESRGFVRIPPLQQQSDGQFDLSGTRIVEAGRKASCYHKKTEFDTLDL